MIQNLPLNIKHMNMKIDITQELDKYTFIFPIENERNWELENVYREDVKCYVFEDKNDVINFFTSIGMKYVISEQGISYFYDNFKEISVTIQNYWLKQEIHTNKFAKQLLLTFCGSKEKVELLIQKFKSSFTFSDNRTIKWFYDTPNGITSNIVALKKNENFIPEFYPFIDDIDTWIEDFFNSKSNVLILLGAPGTGKSSLIREILSRTSKDIYVTYDENLIKGEELYVKFLGNVLESNDQSGILVLEDADIVLMDRENHGNSAMSKLLNLSDGIIDSVDTKFIFTANLENVDQIDHALTRPGRCYDIVEFRKLTYDEAAIAADKAGLPLDNTVNKFTIGEIYNSKKNRSEKCKVGF